VVINDLNIFRSLGARRPFERDAPLFVYSDTVLALSIACVRFQTVAAKLPEVPQAGGCFENSKALFGLAPEAFEGWDSVALSKTPGS
jgi:hypothetical protein